jgi:hypothetical protein
MVTGIKYFSSSSFFIKLDFYLVEHPGMVERVWNLGSYIHTWVMILVLCPLPAKCPFTSWKLDFVISQVGLIKSTAKG